MGQPGIVIAKQLITINDTEQRLRQKFYTPERKIEGIVVESPRWSQLTIALLYAVMRQCCRPLPNNPSSPAPTPPVPETIRHRLLVRLALGEPSDRPYVWISKGKCSIIAIFTFVPVTYYSVLVFLIIPSVNALPSNLIHSIIRHSTFNVYFRIDKFLIIVYYKFVR